MHVVLLEIFSDALGVLERWQHHVIDQLFNVVPRAREPAFEHLVVFHDDVVEHLAALDIIQHQLVVRNLCFHLRIVSARHRPRPQLPALRDRLFGLLRAERVY